MTRRSLQASGLPAPVRGGLFFAGALLALLLAASVASAQPPEPHEGPAKDLGPHGDFARGGEKGGPKTEPLDLTDARRVEWIGAEGGTWHDAASWSGGEVPGDTDIAVLGLPGSYEVVVDADAIVGGLEMTAEDGGPTLAVRGPTLKIRGASRVGPGAVLHLDGGIVTGPGDLEVAGRLWWRAGSMSGAATTRITSSGRLTVEGDRRKVLSLRALENLGTAEWSGTGEWVLTFDAPVRNLAGGSFSVGAEALLDVYGPPGPVFENAGRLRKTGPGTVAFEAPLTNSGEVVVEEGTLELLAGYAQTGGATSVAAGAAIRSPEGFDIEGGTVSGEGSFPHLADTSTSPP